MWAIRILSGPQAGQIFPLNAGKHAIGRGSTCAVKINSDSVSKEHAFVLVTEDKIFIADNNSRNGTYVNGVRIQNQRLEADDKVALHDILLDVLQVPDHVTFARRPGHQHGGTRGPNPGYYSPPAPTWAGNAAVHISHGQSHELAHGQSHGTGMGASPGLGTNIHSIPSGGHTPPLQQQQMSANSLADLGRNLRVYIDNVAMPGVYAVVQAMPYRQALALFVGLYVLTVTALSTIPVVNVTKQNIRAESVRRAKTIARNMAAVNRQPLIDKNDLAISIRSAELEEGVTAALLISAKDGTVIAPTNKRGEFVNQPFVNTARREDKEIEQFIDDSNLGVSVPIVMYSAESGNQTAIAYAIVLYDMGALAMNGSQTLSLFIQTLAIALLVGALLYFFLFKIVEHPLESINVQLDDALREGRDDLRTEYHYPQIERLVINVNTALSRIAQGGPNQHMAFVANRDIEAQNMVRMLPSPALAVNAIDDRVISTNPAFDRLVGGGVNLQGRPLSDIPDLALQQNLTELLPRMRGSVSEMALSEIPFAGNKYEIMGQAVMGAHDPAYYLIVISPMEYAG